MASGGPTRDANDCVPPSRGKTPAGDSLLTARAKVLGGSSWTRSGGKLASEISGIDDGGRDSAPSGITRTPGRTVGTSETKESGGSRGIKRDPRRLGLVTHRDPVQSLDQLVEGGKAVLRAAWPSSAA